MAAKVSILGIEPVGPHNRVQFKVILSGSYVTGGDILDFTQAVIDAAFQGSAAQIDSSQAPVQMDIWSQGGNITDTYFPVVGTSQSNCKFKAASSFNGELAASAYPASMTGDTIVGEALFLKML